MLTSHNVLDEEDLPIGFRNRHQELLNKDVREFGYWIWKPCIVLQALETLDEGEILLYSDVGFHVRRSGRARFSSWVAELASSTADFLVFSSIPPEVYPQDDGRKFSQLMDFQWTKGDTVDKMGLRGSRHLFSPQIGAGIFLVRNSESSRKLIRDWANFMETNPSLIDDSPSVAPDIPGFIEHRHDQSVFSLLIKVAGSAVVRSSAEYWCPAEEELAPTLDVLRNKHMTRNCQVGRSALKGLVNPNHCFICTPGRVVISQMQNLHRVSSGRAVNV
jgi:hypothetical protein